MKILIPVLHYAPVIGGLENWTQHIAEGLSQKVEVFVITGRVRDQLKKEIKNNVKILRTSFYSLSNLSHSSLFYIFTTLPFIFLRSLKIIKKEKIALVFCQGFLSSFLGCLLSAIIKIPFMVTVQRLENKNWQRRIVYNRAKVCIAASTPIKKYFQEIGCKNIEIIPNGIDLNKFKVQRQPYGESAQGRPAKFPLGSRWDPTGSQRDKVKERLGLRDEFVIMTVARLEKVKGVRYLIEAMKDLRFKIYDLRFKLLIIGEGSERKNLENLVQKLNLADKVQFLGELPNSEIPEYLAAADCFCLPSLKEGFGIAILEAMAANLPVIATDIGGIPDIIEDGINGILVKPKNPKEIAGAIIKIYNQPEFAANLIQKAEEGLAKYDWQKIVERVHKMLPTI